MKKAKRKFAKIAPMQSEQKNSIETDSSPRFRVCSRMRDLMAAGTAATIGLSASLCSVNCDPAPQPEWNCSDSASKLWKNGLFGNGAWHLSGAEWTIEVNLTFESWIRQMSSVNFSGNPQVKGATLKVAQIDSSTAAFTCVPDSGAKLITVQMPLKCDSGAVAFKFNLDISGKKSEGAPVQIQPIP
jgi:hypothetical protein